MTVRPSTTPVEEGRTARKRRAILEAATEVFLQNGYLGASMDAVAARAAVSKQTVYKQFTDKDTLFTEVVLGTTVHVVDDLLAAVAATVEDTDDVEASLGELARGFLSGLLRPEVLRLRRLIIAEADRFPEIGRTWFERGFLGSLTALGQSLQRLADRGLLRELDDPALAAHHFAGLVMYIPMNQAMFTGSEGRAITAELEHTSDAAVRVFLAAYGPRNADS